MFLNRNFNVQIFFGISDKRDDKFIKDTCDGEIYANFRDEEAKLNRLNQSFSFSIFTDGISICKKSNVSIWPILLVINELPIEIRFCVDNIVVAGI